MRLKVISNFNKEEFEHDVSVFLRRLSKLRVGGWVSEPKYFVSGTWEMPCYTCIIEYAGDLLEDGDKL